MAHKHTHDHGHSHEHDHGTPAEQEGPPVEELDAAGKSLSDALRISFVILKVIMIVLIVAFLASGFRTVGPNERALVLRFGKIQGVGEEERVLRPGPHWVFPYPVDEMVKIPAEQQINLRIRTFWYKETQADIVGEGPKPRDIVPEKLNPLTEGYCLTRSETALAPSVRPADLTESEASDYSFVHTEWQVVYQIGNVEEFFTNVYVEDVKPGQIYVDVMKKWVTPLLQSVVEDAVVDTMAHYSIDQALQSTDTIPRYVRDLVQKKLDAIGSGIQVTSVQLVHATWPKQVNDAFEAAITASQNSGTTINQAKTYAENTLNNAAGRVAEELYQAISADTTDPNRLDALWSQVAGKARSTIAEAETYRTTVVASAEADATYLERILPEYKKRPELVAQQLYLDVIDQVLRNADEKFVIQPSDGKGQEIRVLVNRDITLPPKQGQKKPATDQTTTTSQ